MKQYSAAVRRSAPMAFWVPGWPLEECPNGIVSYVANLRSGLKSLDVDSLVLAPREARPAETDVIGVTPRPSLPRRIAGALRRRAGFPRSFFADSSRELQRTLAQLKNQGLVVFEMEESFGWGHLFPVSGVTRALRLHGPWFLNGVALGVPRDSAFEERVKNEGLGIRRADVVTAPSADVLNRVREYYRLDLPRARVIPNPGADVPSSRTWKPEGSKPHQILFVGRFDRHKGGDLVLSAFPRIAEAHPDAELVFAGPDRGFLDDTGRTWNLTQYVEERIAPAYRNRVTLLGHTPPERIEQLRRESGVCVVASRYETFGMVAVEGLAVGCPVVAAAAGGIPEVIDHERTGLLFRPGDEADLADKVLRIFARPEEARDFAAAARREYEARFSPIAVAEAMLEFYQEETGRSLRARR